MLANRPHLMRCFLDSLSLAFPELLIHIREQRRGSRSAKWNERMINGPQHPHLVFNCFLGPGYARVLGEMNQRCLPVIIRVLGFSASLPIIKIERKKKSHSTELLRFVGCFLRPRVSSPSNKKCLCDRRREGEWERVFICEDTWLRTQQNCLSLITCWFINFYWNQKTVFRFYSLVLLYGRSNNDVQIVANRFQSYWYVIGHQLMLKSTQFLLLLLLTRPSSGT